MAKRRNNNEGSIHQRKNGIWRAQVSVQGHRLSFNGITKKECQNWIRKTLDQVDAGLTYTNAQITLEKFMTDWLVNIESTLRPSTWQQYQQITQQHILPSLGKIKLRDLKPNHIQNRYNQMVKQGCGLRTIQLTHAVIHRALGHAVKFGLINRNPDDATSSPKPEHNEMKIYDQVQVLQLMIAAKATEDKYYVLYHLALSTGMRQSELLGLKWSDLDIEQGSLIVQRQLVRKKGGVFEFAAPKTRAGKRKIALGTSTLKILRGHRQNQFQQMQETVESWNEQDLIFTSSRGNQWTNTTS